MRLAVQWPRLGPYHLARLRAAHAHAADRGGAVVALETAGSDTTYAWREETGAEPFDRVQALPSATYEAVSPAAIATAIAASLDQIDPDAVAINSYSTPDAQAALLWARRNHRVAVCMMESKADDADRTAVREWVKRRLVGACDAALAGGTPQRAYLRTLGFPDAYVFEPYDVVDNAFFAAGADAARRTPEASRHLPGLGDDRPFFLASSRFVPRKNLARLLAAFGRYRQSNGKWGLVLLGDGPERSSLEALVERSQTPAVTFAGFQQAEALPAYYGRAGALVHPALVEQWGLVVNEALAAGLPVLVSDRVGAATDLVTEGETGFLFDPEDTDGLASRLAHVAGLPDEEREAIGTRGREHVARWSPEAFGAGLWDAAQAGRDRSDRGPSVALQAIIGALRIAGRTPQSFHAIRE